MCQENIDIVITWVDGDDPVHKGKKNKYLTGRNETSHNDIAGAARYRSTGEIFYCIASILRYAPWVHKIFIVTDNQDPQVNDFVARNFPENKIPIEIVDHTVIFRGYEQYLPTFNSLSIGQMLWRIPGLSENFLYFNDDIFLMSDSLKTDWFHDKKTVLYATKFNVQFASFLRWAKHLLQNHKTFGHKDPMLNAARMMKSDFFFLHPHGPVPMNRLWYEKFYTENPDLLDANIRHRFRHPSQFSSLVCYYLDAYREGLLDVRSSKGVCSFLKPDMNKKGYMARKIAEMQSNNKLIFGCINSLGETTAEEQVLFHQWICEHLNIQVEQNNNIATV